MTPNFTYNCVTGRPQILLIGNGLEYKSGQVSWEKLLENVRVENAAAIPEKAKEELPFPLLYHLLTTPSPAPAHMTQADLTGENQHLAAAMGNLVHQSNEFLDRLPSLGADHIMTTNYSYCVEQAFFPGENFLKKRRSHLFYLATNPKTNAPLRENSYRVHTGYLAGNTGIWHIHGEAALAGSVVLGHDRYGRLLRRIEEECARSRGFREERQFTSWPELFLHGDVYILGLKLLPHEFDLWWLLRRKQRELHSGGRTFFYERRPKDGFGESKHLLLQSYGVELCDAGCDEDVDFDTFYHAALTEIQQRMKG